MGQRLQLHELLLTICPNVYFQASSNVTLKYPCILYEQDSAETEHADNGVYSLTKRYMVTIIDQKPDSVISDKVARLPMSTFSRRYSKDNLNHYIYNVYF